MGDTSPPKRGMPLPACSTARRWTRCARSSGSRGRPATRSMTGMKRWPSGS